MGAEMPVPGTQGSHWAGSAQLRRGVLQPAAVPDRRIERAARPCPFVGEGAAEDIDFEADGRG